MMRGLAVACLLLAAGCLQATPPDENGTTASEGAEADDLPAIPAEAERGPELQEVRVLHGGTVQGRDLEIVVHFADAGPPPETVEGVIESPAGDEIRVPGKKTSSYVWSIPYTTKLDDPAGAWHVSAVHFRFGGHLQHQPVHEPFLLRAAVDYDSTAPIITDVRWDHAVLHPGQQFTIEVEVEDETRVEDVWLSFDNGSRRSMSERLFQRTAVAVDHGAQWTLTYTVPDGIQSGDWLLSWVSARDHALQTRVWFDEVVFTVPPAGTTYTDSTAPVLSDWGTENPDATVGEPITVWFRFDEPAGVESLEVLFATPLDGILPPWHLEWHHDDTMTDWTATVTVPRPWPDGAWRIHSMTVIDGFGNLARPAAEGTPFVLHYPHGTPDNSPPILQGVALHPDVPEEVAPGDTVQFVVDATDAGSGVDSIIMGIETPGHYREFGYAETWLDAEAGGFIVELVVDSDMPSGTWRAQWVRISDAVYSTTQEELNGPSFSVA